MLCFIVRKFSAFDRIFELEISLGKFKHRNDFEVTLTGYGKISVQTYYTDLEGNNGGFTGAASSVDVDDRKDYFLTCDFLSGIIDLNPIGSFESYQQYLSQTSMNINYLKFKGYYTVWSDILLKEECLTRFF